ncbi:hypothetical protein G7Y79_00026g059160 [Physcia stellaris]|nr:hypothetical protein G7Y79_00026g059160 [Physcia stellaris]
MAQFDEKSRTDKEAEKARIEKEQAEAFACRRCPAKFPSNTKLHQYVQDHHQKKPAGVAKRDANEPALPSPPSPIAPSEIAKPTSETAMPTPPSTSEAGLAKPTSNEPAVPTSIAVSAPIPTPPSTPEAEPAKITTIAVTTPSEIKVEAAGITSIAEPTPPATPTPKTNILGRNSLTPSHCTKAFASPSSYTKASIKYRGGCTNYLSAPSAKDKTPKWRFGPGRPVGLPLSACSPAEYLSEPGHSPMYATGLRSEEPHKEVKTPNSGQKERGSPKHKVVWTGQARRHELEMKSKLKKEMKELAVLKAQKSLEIESVKTEQKEEARLAQKRAEGYTCRRCKMAKFDSNTKLHEHIRNRHAKKPKPAQQSAELVASPPTPSVSSSQSVTSSPPASPKLVAESPATSTPSEPLSSSVATPRKPISWAEIASRPVAPKPSHLPIATPKSVCNPLEKPAANCPLAPLTPPRTPSPKYQGTRIQ